MVKHVGLRVAIIGRFCPTWSIEIAIGGKYLLTGLLTLGICSLYASTTVPKRSGHLSCLSPTSLVIKLCTVCLSMVRRRPNVGNPEPLAETLYYLCHEFASPVCQNGGWDRDSGYELVKECHGYSHGILMMKGPTITNSMLPNPRVRGCTDNSSHFDCSILLAVVLLSLHAARPSD